MPHRSQGGAHNTCKVLQAYNVSRNSQILYKTVLLPNVPRMAGFCRRPAPSSWHAQSYAEEPACHITS
jgi:hypothetical protein